MIDYRSIEGALRGGGLLPDTITAGKLMRCKVDGDRGGKKSGAYRLFDDERPTCWWQNFKTGETGVWMAASDRPMTDMERNRQRQRIEQAKKERQQEQAEQWGRNHGKITAMWNAAQPLTEASAAGVYLDRRGLVVPNTEALRFVPRLDYWHDGELIGRYPVMLAAVTDPAGDLVALHRTFITSEGDKAPVPTVKKLTHTAGLMAGASIKIGAPVPRPDGGLGLGVAEGIETAIAAAMLGGVPVWPCVSAHGLAAFVLPASVRNLYVFADNDENNTGQDAAARLADRAVRSGVVARVLIPEAAGDWNDELQARRAAA